MLRLTATDLPRFVQCNGFFKLERIPEFDKDTTLRDEGDAAHWVSETVFKGEATLEELIGKKAPNGFRVDAGMAEHCEEYIEAIKGRGEVEVDTSYSGEGWVVVGRPDHRSREGVEFHVRDFKYGYKIVEPDENWTLISHVIEYFLTNPEAGFDVKEIVITIFQPRAIHHKGTVREWRISLKDLWYNYWPKLRSMLENPSNALTTGPSCYRCASFAVCPAATINSMRALETSTQAFTSKLTPKQTSLMLDQMVKAQDTIKQALRAHEDNALHQAKKGVCIPNYSLQTGKTGKKWKEGVTVDSLSAMTGVDLYKKTLLTPLQAAKTGVKQEVLDIFLEPKKSSLKLVRVSESEQAKKMFGDKK